MHSVCLHVTSCFMKQTLENIRKLDSAGSSRDVNKQATSTDMNLYWAGLGEEVKGIDREVPSGKSVATLQGRSLKWELNP